MDTITQDMIDTANDVAGREASGLRRKWVIGLLTFEEYVLGALDIRRQALAETTVVQP